MNVFAPAELVRLRAFQHAELFSGSTQEWEALALICVAMRAPEPAASLATPVPLASPLHRSAAGPLLGQQPEGVDPVGVLVGDCGDDQLVSPGRVAQPLQLVGDLPRRAGKLGVDPVGDEIGRAHV